MTAEKIKASDKKTVSTAKVKKENKGSKIRDLKIELLKNPTKKKSIKKEIARLLTKQSIENKSGENK
jgi:ribosomal protein L29